MEKHPSEYIRSIAAQALEVELAERHAFIVSACHGDPNAVRAVLDRIGSTPSQSETESTVTIVSAGVHNDHSQNHTLDLGQVIDNRLRIVRFISEGGMGEVYAALDLNLHENVALKTIRSSVAEHPGIIERFKTEVKQSLRITHPNVCRVHQLAMFQDQSAKSIWYLTMELLEGPTLARSLAANGAIQPARALDLIKQMVAGLACAHEAGIVHRDLKPSNIMLVGLVPNERLVITDFGLAVSASSRVEGGLFGTPAYMAPEQWTGRRVGPQADVFALGLIICEMLTGELPALALNSAESCRKQLKAWLSLHPRLPSQILPVIKRCVEYRPEDRFSDAREIRPLLENKRRTVERVAVVIVLIAVLFGLVSAVRSRIGERVVDAAQLTPDGVISAEPNLSVDGKYIAYMSNRADPANLDIWLQTIASGDARRLTRNPAQDSYPTISPDGKVVAFRSERDGGGIYLIGSDGTDERLLISGGREPAFSPDGRLIAYWQGPEDTLRAGELYVYPVNHGPPRRLATDFDDARYPAWDVDGHLFFFGCPAKKIGSSACPDWWVVDPNGDEPANTEVSALLRANGISLDLPPNPVWQRGHVLVSGRQGRTFHVWDVLLRTDLRAVGHPRQVTFGDTEEKWLTSAESGVIAIEHVSGALHLWRIAAIPAGNRLGLEKLTDSVQTDCCPAVSRDSHSLFFTRRLGDARQLMKLDLLSGKESMVYVSDQNKLWPLPNSKGDLVVFESRAGGQSSIVVWKQNLVRTICEGCSHPSAWVTDGREFLYTTSAGDIGLLEIESGHSRTVVSADQGYVLGYPDWNSKNQQVLFTASKGAVKQVFEASMRREDALAVETWIPLTSSAESADLARWAADGKKFFYFSRKDGYYCLWENSFDPMRGTVATASPVQHFHDWGKGPSRTTPYVLGISVDEHSIYTNVGEVASTIWQGYLHRDPLSNWFRRVFEQ